MKLTEEQVNEISNDITPYYEWVIDSVTVSEENGLSDVVKIVNWHLIAYFEKFTGVVIGQTELGNTNPANFISLNELTSDQVISFCESSGMDKASIEQEARYKIHNQRSPKTQSKRILQ